MVTVNKYFFCMNLPIHKDMHLFFSISNLSEGNSDIKYLKSLYSKFDMRVSIEALINCKKSIKVIFF